MAHTSTGSRIIVANTRPWRVLGSVLGSAALIGGLAAIGATPAAATGNPDALNPNVARNPAHIRSVHVRSVTQSKPKRAFLSSIAPQAVGAGLVFTVNKTTDSVDANPGNGACADAAHKCSLRAAIQEANALKRPVTINVPAGTFALSIAPNNATTVPDDVTSGDLNVTDPGGIVIKAAGATINATILGDRIFEVDGGASLWLSGATLAGGHAADASSHSSTDGGALSLPDPTSAATLQGVTLTGNAAANGGGISVGRGALWLTGSTVSNNAATSNYGGGIDNSGFPNGGAAQIVNDKITGNTAPSQGGGIHNNGGPVAILGSIINGNRVLVPSNSTGEGGGVHAQEATIIDGSTIADNSVGPTPGAVDVGAFGGGVSNEYGLESITNSVIDHNTVTPNGTKSGEGGGIYDDNGTVVANSKVTNNSVHPASPFTNLDSFGGAISNESGTTQITGTFIDHNSELSGGSGDGEGGGIYDSTGVTVTGSTVSNNTAGIQNQASGGGGAGGGISEEGNNLLVLNSRIIGNQALGGAVGSFNGSGGGIMANDIATVTNTVIANNHAAQQGGGMWSDDGQHVRAVTFSGNTAQQGGGIWNEWQMDVANSTISGNSTSGPNNNGGGVFDQGSNSNAKVILSSSTVANNAASAGSGLSVGLGLTPINLSGFVLKDTIVGANTGSPQCHLTGATLTSIGHNLSSDTSCALVASGDITGVNPALNPLADNGGPTATLSLQKTSPAIDAGDCPAIDQRGFPRPPVRCDIGAYEQSGYRFLASDGGVFDFGDAGFWGSTSNVALSKPIVGLANTVTGRGYYMVASDGGVFTFGDAAFHGSKGGSTLNSPIVGMAVTPSGNGYWLIASDGGIFTFGDAAFHGSTGGMTLNKPIVGMAPTPDGNGYWLIASDGGVFTFGNATFHGSTGGMTLNKPIVGGAGV